MSETRRLRRLTRGAAEGLLFLARMWVSEQRFQRHARRRAAHEAAAARRGDLMAAEIAYRVRLCRRWDGGKPKDHVARTAGGVPAVSRLDGPTMPAAIAPHRAPGLAPSE